MAYLLKQKFNISYLSDVRGAEKRILIHEPDDYLAALYGHYLRAHNFDVKHCPDLAKIQGLLAIYKPDVFVFNADYLPKSSFAGILLSNLAQNFPNLRLVSTGFSGGNGCLKELMAAGVLGHINRKFSQPQDLVLVVKSVLHI